MSRWSWLVTSAFSLSLLGCSSSGSGGGGAVGCNTGQIGEGDYCYGEALSAVASTGEYYSPITMGDVDGDSDLDVLVGSQLFVNDGSGKLTASAVVGSPVSALADMNGDGVADLVYSISEPDNGSYPQAELVVQLNDGAGTFGAPSKIFPPVAVTAAEDAMAIGVADLDGDGDLDVALTTHSSGQGAFLYLFRNDGNGGIDAAIRRAWVTDEPGFEIGFGQILAGGNPEILVPAGWASSPELEVFDFSGWVNAAGGPSYATNSTIWFISTGDIGGDGDIDAVATSLASGLQILLSGASSMTSLATAGTVLPSDAILLDVDGDGWSEIVTADGTDDAIEVGFQDHTSGAWSWYSDALPPGANPQRLASADLNGDGAPDLVVLGTSMGSARLYVILDQP